MTPSPLLSVSESEDLFALAQEAGRVGVFEWDVPSGSVRVSSTLLAVYGLATFDGRYESWLALVLREDQARLNALMEVAFAAQDPDFRVEFRVVSSDQAELRWMEARSRVFYDEGGSPVRVVSAHVDITERKFALTRLRAFTDTLEEAVRERTRELALNDAFTAKILEHNPDCIAVLDLGGRLIFINHGAGQLFLGFDDFSPFTGAPFEGLFPIGSRDLLRAAIRLAGQGEPSRFLAFCPTADGKPTWWDVLVTPMQGPDGRPERLLCISRDTTLREEQARQQREAQSAAERAQAAAEAASQAKSDFLAAMSHEIRTPLNGVLGYTDLLLGSGIAGAERSYAERIRAAGEALLTVVNDVLDFSRIEAGKIDLDLQPFELAELVGGAVSIVQEIAGAKGLAISVAVDPDLPPMLVGDGGRLRQILLNLLNNAIKFTSRGHVRLTVVADGARRDDERCGLRVSVTDTGIGIANDKFDRLFQRFSQVDGSIRRSFGGTGLGLAISKQLVEAMGGEIGVDSVPGAGSTFWFKLALPVGPQRATADGDGRGAAERRTAPRGARILLAEDLEINQDLVRLVLEAEGHRVDIVADGAEAVAAVQAAPYDVVLMDVQMPGMDGLTATRRIRALDGHPVARSLPIIALTASVLPGQVVEYRRAGMDGHIGKPFKPKELLAFIGDLMHRIGVAESEARTGPGRASPAIDPQVHAELAQFLGPARMEAVVTQIAQRATALAGELGGSAAAPERVAQDARTLMSLAGQAGFAELSSLCREIEELASGGQMDGARMRASRLERAGGAAREAASRTGASAGLAAVPG